MRANFEPRDCQKAMIDFALEHPRHGLFAEMGLGKTVSMLTALDIMFLCGIETKPALVLAPLRVAQSTWPDEAAKWSHLSGIEVQPVVGSEDERKRALRNKNASIFTVNYENIPWLRAQCADRWPFGMVVADESTRLKGFRLRQGTKRAQAIGGIAHRHASRWSNLSGTPSPNGIIDLWGQLWFLDAGQRLGRTFSAFEQRWFRRSFDGFSLEPLPHAQEEIQRLISDLCLSLRTEDYFDIAEPIRNKINIRLPARARAIYKDMENRFFAEIEGTGVEALSSAARSQKCLQLANGAVYVDENTQTWKEVHDVKIQALESVISESGGKSVLVAYHHRSDLARLKRAFPKGRELDRNPQTIKDWNAGRIALLFAHPASAGHGLNLQDGGNILVFFAVDWNLELHQQIVERIGPMRQKQAGHERPVYIHYLIAEDTIDELVLQRLESKRSVQDILMDALRRRT